MTILPLVDPVISPSFGLLICRTSSHLLLAAPLPPRLVNSPTSPLGHTSSRVAAGLRPRRSIGVRIRQAGCHHRLRSILHEITVLCGLVTILVLRGTIVLNLSLHSQPNDVEDIDYILREIRSNTGLTWTTRVVSSMPTSGSTGPCSASPRSLPLA